MIPIGADDGPLQLDSLLVLRRLSGPSLRRSILGMRPQALIACEEILGDYDVQDRLKRLRSVLIA